MQIRFFGTRGSIATPGPGTVRYGGNTSCVELRSSAGTLIMLDIDNDKIHLWLTFFHEIIEQELLDRYQDLLTPDEQRQHSLFHFESDRHRYLATRALVRTVLSQYCTLRPQDWTFTTNAFGRPAISNTDSRAQASRSAGVSPSLSKVS